jgi:hypothetical protein
MHQPVGQRWHLPWLAALADLDPPDGLAVLHAMQPARGYNPDFLTPTPTTRGTTLPEEAGRVARTPLARLAHELACWDALLAAHWPRIQRLLDADIAHHARQLADHGLIALLNQLHPDVRWRGDDVEVCWQQGVVEQSRELGGAGIVLMPSAFTWPHPIAVLDPPWQPTIVYPARGVGVLWQRLPGASAALSGVVGPTRARLLTDLVEPASTTSLAERYEMAASTISRHLILLQTAGLARAHRDGHQVLYQRTSLGAALSAPQDPDGPALTTP